MCLGYKAEQGSIPGPERPPAEGNGNPLHYSRQENSMDRGAWLAIVRGVTKESDMTEQLSMHTEIEGMKMLCQL